MASRLQDVILRGLRADQPLATSVASGTLYYVTDEAVTERASDTSNSIGGAWETYTDTGGGGGGGGGTGGSGMISSDEGSYDEPMMMLSVGTVGATGPTGATGLRGPMVYLEPELLEPDPPIPGARGVNGTNGATGAQGPPGLGLDGDTGDDGYPIPNPSLPRTRSITLALDGGGSALTTGIKADVYVPYACTIIACTMLADQSGSIVVDIWKLAYGSYPPTVANTITAAAKPTITTALKSQDNTLTGWTKSVIADDTLRFNVDSITTVTRLNLTLTVLV